jgi:hypothetical protein
MLGKYLQVAEERKFFIGDELLSPLLIKFGLSFASNIVFLEYKFVTGP